MERKRILTSVLVVSVVLGSGLLLGIGKAVEKTVKASRVIVGTFDSRAVKIAYDHAVLAGRVPDVEAHDPNATPEQIKRRTIDRREREFRQGFVAGGVSEYLDSIRDEIPKIAKEVGVDVIVSKWDIEYHSPNVEFVGVTQALIQPFKPKDETLKVIQDIRKVPPASEKEIRELEESGEEI